jgi:hypothetical protein
VAQDRKLLIVCIDGMRPDAMEAANAPNLHALIANGAYCPNAQSEDLTFSGPNWSSILHGVHRDKHQVTTNDYSNNNLAQYPDLFHYLELHNPAWNTYRIFTWAAAHLGQPTGADVAINREYSANGDVLMTSDAVQILSGTHPTFDADPDAMLLFYSDVDVRGHQFGFHPSVPQYVAEIADVDRQIGLVRGAIAQRPNIANENWLIIVTTDHGGAIDGSHHGNTPEKRTIPFIVSGASAAPGLIYPQARTVDVARTALVFMQVAINPAWGLDGHAVGLMPSGPAGLRYGENLVFNGDGEFDRGFGDPPADQYISGWDDPGPDQFTIVTYGAANGWPTPGDPGPPERGLNFFSGGPSASATLTQTIDVSAIAPDIDAGRVRYDLSAWLGGYATQADQARLTLRFFDEDQIELDAQVLGPVTPAQRGNVTALVLRQGAGTAPAGCRSMAAELIAERFAGTSCDGYADSVRLVLNKPCAADFDDDGVVDLSDLTLLLSAFGCPAGSCPFDADGDGDIDLPDLSLLLSAFGTLCP